MSISPARTLSMTFLVLSTADSCFPCSMCFDCHQCRGLFFGDVDSGRRQADGDSTGSRRLDSWLCDKHSRNGDLFCGLFHGQKGIQNRWQVGHTGMPRQPRRIQHVECWCGLSTRPPRLSHWLAFARVLILKTEGKGDTGKMQKRTLAEWIFCLTSGRIQTLWNGEST